MHPRKEGYTGTGNSGYLWAKGLRLATILPALQCLVLGEFLKRMESNQIISVTWACFFSQAHLKHLHYHLGGHACFPINWNAFMVIEGSKSPCKDKQISLLSKIIFHWVKMFWSRHRHPFESDIFKFSWMRKSFIGGKQNKRIVYILTTLKKNLKWPITLKYIN